MRVYSLTPLLLALLLVPPKPKAPSSLQIVATCPTTGTCRLIATWNLPPTWRVGDSLGVVWSQVQPSSVAFLRTHYTKGTADTLPLPRTVEGKAFSGTVAVTSYRPGFTSGTAQKSTSTWTAPAVLPVGPDVVDSLKVAPISATLVPPGTVQFTATVWSHPS